MQSEDNPLYTTKQFYPDSKNASRGNVTSNHMFANPNFSKPGAGGGGISFPSTMQA